MGQLVKKKFKIIGMHCTSCALNIDMDLEDLQGIKCAKTSYAKQTTEVDCDEEQVSDQQIIEVIKKLGFNTSSVVN